MTVSQQCRGSFCPPGQPAKTNQTAAHAAEADQSAAESAAVQNLARPVGRPAAASAPKPAGSRRWTSLATDSVWLCVFVLCGLLVMSRSKADPDLWGHVTYGKEVLRDGHLHQTTTWSYAVDQFRWINHENIAELLMAAADRFAGQTGLLLLKSLLTLLVLGLPLWAARRLNAGLITCAAITALVSLSISFHWLVRPHMLSYTCGAGLLAILTTGLPGAVTARTTQRPRWWLWLVPLLMCFWTNAHGGYLAGLAILTAWLGLDAVELLLHKDSRFWPTVRRHALLWTVTVAACCVNPYGLELHQWMLSSLGRPRPEISEWAPLPLLTTDGLPFWGLLFAGFLCLKKTDQPLRWPALIVTGLLGWQAVSHHRHLPFLALMAAFVLVPHIESLVRQALQWCSERRSRRTASRPVAALCRLPAALNRPHVASIPLALVLIAGCSVLQYPRQARLHVDSGYYPVAAMQYMADRRLSGKVLVTFNWAQYALAVFSEQDPDSRIAFDGRFRTCYPQAVIDMYFDFLLGDVPDTVRYREADSGPFNPTRALDYKSPDLVLIERNRTAAATVMRSVQEEWTLLYQDSLAELWGRREIYDDPASPRYLSPVVRQISDDLQQGSVAWPAFPNKTVMRVAVR